MTISLSALLHRLSRSFVVQAMVAAATIALVAASTPVATADSVTVPSIATTLAGR